MLKRILPLILLWSGIWASAQTFTGSGNFSCGVASTTSIDCNLIPLSYTSPDNVATPIGTMWLHDTFQGQGGGNWLLFESLQGDTAGIGQLPLATIGKTGCSAWQAVTSNGVTGNECVVFYAYFTSSDPNTPYSGLTTVHASYTFYAGRGGGWQRTLTGWAVTFTGSTFNPGVLAAPNMAYTFSTWCAQPAISWAGPGIYFGRCYWDVAHNLVGFTPWFNLT